MIKEKIFKGIAASQGISMGMAYLYTRRQISISHNSLKDEEEVSKEVENFKQAIESSLKELNKIYKLSLERIGEQNSKIFEAQIEILQDNIFISSIINRIINEKKSAGYIFHDEISKLGNILMSANNDYMKERFADVNDIKNRVLRNMKREKLVSKVEENTVIFAHELSPADTILFSRRKVIGYATDAGGFTSHTAIISRALRIPAVVGMKVITKNITTGEYVIIDGYDGIVIVNPKPDTIEEYKKKKIKYKNYEEKLIENVELPCETKDKETIEVTVNIDLLEEVDLLSGCSIGLFRTEHLFMEKGEFPSEAEQIEEYSHIANVIFPKYITIRTFDIGGDKLLSGSHKEVNPNLGWRGIRICLDRITIFKEQLRAILLSSVKKNIRLMFPMISTIEEVRKSKKILKEVMEELDTEGYMYDKEIKVGIMIEVPSAALLSNELAKEVDFFSIGTNDLTQYLLAVDRGNELISGMYDHFHPSLIRLIKFTVDNAYKNKIKVSICGELGSDPIAIPLLLGLGIKEISVNPSILPEIKHVIRSIKYTDTKKIAGEILNYSTSEEIKNRLIEYYYSIINR